MVCGSVGRLGERVDGVEGFRDLGKGILMTLYHVSPGLFVSKAINTMDTEHLSVRTPIMKRFLSIADNCSACPLPNPSYLLPPDFPPPTHSYSHSYSSPPLAFPCSPPHHPAAASSRSTRSPHSLARGGAQRARLYCSDGGA